jgi:hypothetical protein
MVQSFDMTRLDFNMTAPVHARVYVGRIVVWKEDGQISGTKVLQNLKLVVLKYKTLVPSTSVELHLPRTSPGEDTFYCVQENAPPKLSGGVTYTHVSEYEHDFVGIDKTSIKSQTLRQGVG